MIENKFLTGTTFGRTTDADYIPSLIPAYMNNPLEEALPGFFTPKDVLLHLSNYPIITDEMKDYPSEVRQEIVYNFNQFYKPDNRHVDLFNALSRAIRSGYASRNPARTDYFKDVKERASSQYDVSKDSVKNKIDNKLPGFTFIGWSGIGKTSSVKKILQMFPQVIRHSSYKGKDFVFTQIVWMIIECPAGGGLTGFLINFFYALDQILHTDNCGRYTQKGRASVDVMMQEIKHLVGVFAIGAIVIDEIHRLIKSHGIEKGRLLEFFAELANIMGVPIIPIGKPSAKELFGGDLQTARRYTGQGDIEWNRFQEDYVWDNFIESLWCQQILKKPSELTSEIKQKIYFLTQGIVDFVIKLFVLSQIRAIQTKQEAITIDILLSVSLDSFNNAKRILTALRMNEADYLNKIDDIPEINYPNFLSNAIPTSTPILNNGTTSVEYQPTLLNSQEGETHKDIFQNKSKSKNIEGKPKNGKKTAKYSENDLRLIPKNADEHNVTVYTELSNSGNIRSADEIWKK